jgi:hypothetical protein
LTRTKLAPSFWQVIDANYHTQLLISAQIAKLLSRCKALRKLQRERQVYISMQRSVEARYALQTDDGLVIAVINRGVRRGSDECVERFHMMLEKS